MLDLQRSLASLTVSNILNLQSAVYSCNSFYCDQNKVVASLRIHTVGIYNSTISNFIFKSQLHPYNLKWCELCKTLHQHMEGNRTASVSAQGHGYTDLYNAWFILNAENIVTCYAKHWCWLMRWCNVPRLSFTGGLVLIFAFLVISHPPSDSFTRWPHT